MGSQRVDTTEQVTLPLSPLRSCVTLNKPLRSLSLSLLICKMG